MSGFLAVRVWLSLYHHGGRGLEGEVTVLELRREK